VLAWAPGFELRTIRADNPFSFSSLAAKQIAASALLRPVSAFLGQAAAQPIPLLAHPEA